jgi:hypothetical protein
MVEFFCNAAIFWGLEEMMDPASCAAGIILEFPRNDVSRFLGGRHHLGFFTK